MDKLHLSYSCRGRCLQRTAAALSLAPPRSENPRQEYDCVLLKECFDGLGKLVGAAMFPFNRTARLLIRREIQRQM